MSSPFSSVDLFQSAFESGLEELLNSDEGLGSYILVLANAGFDPRIWAHLAEPLRIKFERLGAVYREHQEAGLDMAAAEDDLHVFEQLLALGFDGLEHTAFHQRGPWELQYNPLRSFRPPRISGGLVEGVSAPFNPEGFHFAKPFLKKEIFWEGSLGGREVALFYNKFPFVEFHGLLVPEYHQGRPQLLTKEDHHYIWEVAEALSTQLSGVGFGYNSFGAYASVNHLHFQMFVRSKPLPVTDARWRHNDGSVEYPAHCRRFTRVDEAWVFIEEMHRVGRGYNLAYLPGVVYCTPRPQQGSVPVAHWSSGFAWHEMMGSFSLFDHQAFLTLTEAELEGALHQAGLSLV